MLNHEEYERALKRVEELALLDPAPETEEGRALIALADCVIEYELKHFPFTAIERTTEAS